MLDWDMLTDELLDNIIAINPRELHLSELPSIKDGIRILSKWEEIGTVMFYSEDSNDYRLKFSNLHIYLKDGVDWFKFYCKSIWFINEYDNYFIYDLVFLDSNYIWINSWTNFKIKDFYKVKEKIDFKDEELSNLEKDNFWIISLNGQSEIVFTWEQILLFLEHDNNKIYFPTLAKESKITIILHNN